MLIGIAGGSGSGKTIIAKIMQEKLGEDQTSIISFDYFYPDLSHIIEEERVQVNYDDPNLFDYNEIFLILTKLRAGKSVKIPEYDFATHTRSDKLIELKSRENIIFEGLFTFFDQKIFNLFDKTFFIETNKELRLQRRITRDRVQRNRTKESVVNQWNKTVEPMYDKYIVNAKEQANKIITNNGKLLSELMEINFFGE